MVYKKGDRIRLTSLTQIDRWNEFQVGMVFVVDGLTELGVRSGGHGFLNSQIELVEEEFVTIPFSEYEDLIICKQELDNLYENDLIKEND